MDEVAATDTRLDAVTVYARGARIRRSVSIAAAGSRVQITGLPLAVIEDTVRVSVEGSAIATNVRVAIDTPPQASAPEESAAVREAKRLVAIASAELARLEAGLERLRASSVLGEDPSDDPPASWAAIVSARRAVLAVRTERELALRSQLTAARKTLDAARLDLEVALDRDRNSARDARPHELRKRLDIELAGSGPITLHVEYLVVAARWAPSYVARIDGAKASFELRAVIAQDTGEDWRGAKLVLSTAEPARFAQLPELAAQRIGRKQAEPPRSGFRAAPVGAEALYADYQRYVAQRAERDDDEREQERPTAPFDAEPSFAVDDGTVLGGVHARAQSFAEENWDEETSAAKDRFSTPPRGAPVMDRRLAAAMPAAAPSTIVMDELAAPERKKSGKLMAKRAAGGEGGGGLRDEPAATKPTPTPGEPSALLDYKNLVMADARSAVRGRLIAAPQDGDRAAIQRDVTARETRIELLALPPGCVGSWSHSYDYAYATDGAIDVASDAAWHSIAVTASAAAVHLRHVAVPREQPDVFRIATLVNPFPAPLLPGPIDVYDRGRFLVTSSVEQAPPGATLEIGLGVDAAVKVARNTEFREEATGMLRGSLKLHHGIAIDVDNVSAQPVELEVRERIPVAREGDDDVEIALGRVEPAWEPWKPDADGPRMARLRGGYRWRISLPAGAKTTLRAAYEVKISGKAELVGGNRRET
jgi:hypothetical protein